MVMKRHHHTRETKYTCNQQDQHEARNKGEDKVQRAYSQKDGTTKMEDKALVTSKMF